jgi:hypothetical protein
MIRLGSPSSGTATSSTASSLPLSLACTLLAVVPALAGCTVETAANDGSRKGAFTEDPPLVASVQDDCSASAYGLLASETTDSNVDGPIARYAGSWSKIVGSVSRNPSIWSGRKSARFSDGIFPAGCTEVLDIFGERGGDHGGESIEYETDLSFEVQDFDFPSSLAYAVARPNSPVDVTVSASLRISYWKRPSGGTGGTAVNGLPTRTYPVELACKTPFQVAKRVETRPAVATNEMPFCPINGDRYDCITYQLRYTGDDCGFVVRRADVLTPSGKTVPATIAGRIARSQNTSGYTLTVSRVDVTPEHRR